MSYSTRDITPGGYGGGSSSSSMFPGRHDFDFHPRRSSSTRRPSTTLDPFERSTSTSRRPSYAPEPRRSSSSRGGFSDLPDSDFFSSGGASGRRGAVVDDTFDRRPSRSMFSDLYASMPSRDIGAGTTGYSRYRNDAPPSSYARYESRPTMSSSRSRYSERSGSILDDPFARQAAASHSSSSSRYGSSREGSRYPPSSYDRYAAPSSSSTRRPLTSRFVDQYYSGSDYEMRGHRDDPFGRRERSSSSSSSGHFRFF
ncbi:hypothetical protein LTR78_000658 [Recurvomyces mirabilis]|uniref:Uncharacterized protein n=1 Tax=Recurvomyces mirabilis TaxID=574656 RepID=A0AAE0WXP6_9PEZI|nr:hypothetical protein LTR78_000658 [Recurvomyces mirabilis]KAK5162312.1 hypothetical protein LTS14_000659 [Recurvomyces mirabilis]